MTAPQGATPVLRVADYPRAKAHYEKLGFKAVEEGGSPPRFGIFVWGRAQIFLDGWHGADTPPSPGWRAYLPHPDVAGLAKQIAAAGLMAEGPNETGYGMREVVVTDPDGNRLCFGQDVPG